MQIFRTLTGIIDDYFDGYYSEEMIESQVYISALFFLLFGANQAFLLLFYIPCFLLYVGKGFWESGYFCIVTGENSQGTSLQVDQLALEELVRERFPKLGL